MGGDYSRSIARCKVSSLPSPTYIYGQKPLYIYGHFFQLECSNLRPDPYPVDSGADTVLYARLLHTSIV